MSSTTSGLFSSYRDVWVVDAIRTPFAEYNGLLRDISPTDMGIKVARALFARTGVSPGDVGCVLAGNVAQASFDAFVLPRHIGLYSGVPVDVPALLVQRVCGTGFELFAQAGDGISLGKFQVALCVGTESMTRNPVAAYTHRGGFRMGQVEFKDFLWEALRDTAPNITMGETAENLAKKYAVSREDVDRFAESSFRRALAAQTEGYFAGEIVPVETEAFELQGYKTRGIRLSSKVTACDRDDHIRPSAFEALQKLRPAFGGVQTGGNSSGIVDGAAAALVASGDYVRARAGKPLARLAAAVTVGVAPEIMGIGPAPAIRLLLERTGLKLSDIDRFEINEAFAAQCLAVERELGLDHAKVNVNGGGRHRPSAWRHRRAAYGHLGARTAPAQPALRDLERLHRRRPGDRAPRREPRRSPAITHRNQRVGSFPERFSSVSARAQKSKVR